MLKIRRLTSQDKPAVGELIERLDLAYPGQRLDNFWVAEENQAVVGLADLKEFDGYFFLSSVGIDEKYRHRGLASTFLKDLLQELNKDVFIYTIIPGFFSRLGFKKIKSPSFLPAREVFNCAGCAPAECVCMVRGAK